MVSNRQRVVVRSMDYGRVGNACLHAASELAKVPWEQTLEFDKELVSSGNFG